MINLRINKTGYYIQIPGMSPFRTPAVVNISHISIPLVVSILKTEGITEFEIISDTKGKEQLLTQNDFVVLNKKPKKQVENYESRFNKLEDLLDKLIQKQTSDIPLNKEQINNRLSNIENLIKNTNHKVVHAFKHKSEFMKEKIKVEDTLDAFIPEIDLEGLEIKGKSSQKTIKQDKLDIDDNADLLSRIMQTED